MVFHLSFFPYATSAFALLVLVILRDMYDFRQCFSLCIVRNNSLSQTSTHIHFFYIFSRQILHPYIATGLISLLYQFSFLFLDISINFSTLIIGPVDFEHFVTHSSISCTLSDILDVVTWKQNRIALSHCYHHHEILLCKLQTCGSVVFHSSGLRAIWVADSYLSNFAVICKGVSQEFILGSILFNVFMRDISTQIVSTLIIYAYDTSLVSDRDLTSLANKFTSVLRQRTE